MKRKELRYCVVSFLELPYKGIDDYVCIPSSWIIVRVPWQLSKVAVAYPVKKLPDMEKRVEQRQKLEDEWRYHMAIVYYYTDIYEDAQIFINGQIGNVQNKINGGHELLERKTCRSKHKENLNHKMEMPQESVISKKKNDDISVPEMKAKKFKYCVVDFLELPNNTIDNYVCIPWSWIVLSSLTDQKVIVSYPDENPSDTEIRVKRREQYPLSWLFYLAIAKYATDSYADAQIFIKEQDLSERISLNSKRKFNHEADIPQELILKENNNHGKPAEKTRMKMIALRMKIPPCPLSTGGQRPPPSAIASTGPVSLATVTKAAESGRKVAILPKQTPETTNENQRSSAHENIPTEISLTQEIPVDESNYENRAGESINNESSTLNTPFGIQNSSNQANQSLDPANNNINYVNRASVIQNSSNQANQSFDPANNNINYENRAEETPVLESSTQNRPSVITHTTQVIANSLTSYMPLKKMILARCNFNL